MIDPKSQISKKQQFISEHNILSFSLCDVERQHGVSNSIIQRYIGHELCVFPYKLPMDSQLSD